MQTSLLVRLRERGVLRVAAGYAVIAWLLLQIADVTFEPLGVPKSVMPSLIVAAVLGFLGPSAEARLFVPESFWAAREWHGLVSGERELLFDELIIDPPEALGVLVRRRPELSGLAFLAERGLLEGARARPPG